ncbi:hypothetical protein GCM10010377_48590 [Streptomyces viridiviolaceus]|nr:hypothetical protein GCM10010377_48590 [Streptomyces viridiviolaceus]
MEGWTAVEQANPAEARRGYADDWLRFTARCASTGVQPCPRPATASLLPGCRNGRPGQCF